MALASPFVIKELTGDGRTLYLAGRALPYRPLQFSGTMRAEFTWYPGNPEATVQVFGASEEDTTINGMWKDRFLKRVASPQLSLQEAVSLLAGEAVPLVQIENPEAIALLDGRPFVDVMHLVKTVDDFRRKGQLVEVTWDEIVRRGIITRFTYKFDRRQDVEWELTFGWISQGGKQVPAVLPQGPDPSDLFAALRGQLQRLFSAVVNPVIAVVDGLLTTLAVKAAAIEADVAAVEDSLAGVVSTAIGPVDGVRRIIATVENIKSNADAIGRALFAQPSSQDVAAAGTTGTSLDPAGGDVTVGKAVGVAKYKRDVALSAKNMQRTAAQRQADLLKNASQEILGSFLARKDMDLREVSTKFYGTPDEWSRVMLYNGFKTSKLSEGQVVFVPIKTTGRVC